MAAPGAYKALISDLGGVVVALDYGPFNAFLARSIGIAPERVWAALEQDAFWRQYELGRTDAAGCAKAVSRVLGTPLTREEFLSHWNRILAGPMDGIETLYREVKARGLTMLVLSNTNEDHIVKIREQCPVMTLFDAVYCSHEIAARKPDAAAFGHVLADRGLNAASCLFIDDVPENIQSARALGMTGILAQGTESIRTALCEAGVIKR